MSTNRRSFLAKVAALAAATPLAVAVPAAATTAPAKAAAPAATPPRLPPSFDGHDPEEAAYDRCPCRHCTERRGWDEALHLTTVIALYAADAALSRFLGGHCDDGPARCDTCLDASACRFVLSWGIPALEGNMLIPDGYHDRVKEARSARQDLPAADAALIALHDALDALFDLTVGHCDERDCLVCEDADGLAYFVHLAANMLGGGCAFGPVVQRRELLSAERMAARLRDCPLECMMPHTSYLHPEDPQREVAFHRELAQLAEGR